MVPIPILKVFMNLQDKEEELGVCEAKYQAQIQDIEQKYKEEIEKIKMGKSRNQIFSEIFTSHIYNILHTDYLN